MGWASLGMSWFTNFRFVELEAYSSVVYSLRAQGELDG